MNTKMNNLISIVKQYDVAPNRFHSIKDDITALKSMVEELSNNYGEKKITQVTNNFLFGYEFERINQEFDLLKAVETPYVESKQNFIINIELKKVLKKY